MVVIETLAFSKISSDGDVLYPLNQNEELPVELLIIVVFTPIWILAVSPTSFATLAVDSIIFTVRFSYMDRPLG